ncbi:hypothetical protein GQ44DRAFT_79554 [Phaeosphaeriaceae sp. PMI808]|nr:hypothetical protein GQ44DRAFT_79554 [Phaeosphaeriaceae sp. PMI808]
MPSHLTRLVFRSIIANEPLLYRGCRHRVVWPRAVNSNGARALPYTQRRSFLDLFKQRRKPKPVEIPPGLDILGKLLFAQSTGERPPQPQVVADALRDFFAQKKGAYEDFHIAQTHAAFNYLLENPQDNGQPWLSALELHDKIYNRMLQVVHLPQKGGSEHVKFGKAIISEYAKQLELDSPEKAMSEARATQVDVKLVRLLAQFGAATEARDIAASALKVDSNATPEHLQASLRAWNNVLKSIVQEGDMEQMRQTAALIRRLNVPVTPPMQYHLVAFFAEQKEMDEARFWYAYSLTSTAEEEEAQPVGRTSAALLKASALSSDLSFGHQVVASLLKDDMPNKAAWDAVFLWSAAIGKGVDEVDRMMSVMVRRNDEARQKTPSVEVIRPDIDTINTLVEFSMSKQDPYSAERYITLGEKRGISPNERTYTMQIQYRLSVKDIDGARAAYFNLQSDFSGEAQSVLAINQLIQTLCELKYNHFDDLMVMVDDLHERKARFAPETIASLCLLHLRRGESYDAIDLLQVHAHQFTPAQRRIIQNNLLVFILDGETSTTDAWDTYQILRKVFVETPRDDRVKIMNDFFERKRPDMACHVFFHMRNHVSREYSANRDVYVAAFTGFARCADAESLELAHNQLKLDFNVDIDTRLRNSLMLAYAATGENTKALQFWREICESKEGPSYNSITIAFRSCEGMHYGYQHARSIWQRLKEQDVEIDKTIWLAYMSAITRNHQHDDALALIENVEEEYGFTPDLDILGNWFNMTASSDRQTRVEAWIKKRYPEVWQEIESLGHWVTMDGFGYRQYNLNRDVDP